MQNVTSSDKKYRSQRKENIFLELLSNTLMIKNLKNVFGGLWGVKNCLKSLNNM